MSESKQVAVLQGEVDGLVCKLNGYERALQDCELQLAERDLQVVLLKTFIKDLDSPSDLQLNFQELLEHNSHLQQQLQELSHATHAAQAPAQASTTTSMQASLLRAALAEANYRLTGAGLLPVAATSLQRSQQQDLSTSGLSIPANRRSYSRLFRNKYSSNSTNKPSCSSITPSSSTGSKASPCAPALLLPSKLSGALTPAEGPDTPVGFFRKLPACTPGSVSFKTPATSAFTTPAHDMPQPAETVTSTAAAGGSLNAAFEGAARADQVVAAGVEADRVRPSGSVSGFVDVTPYSYDTCDFSDSDDASTTPTNSNASTMLTSTNINTIISTSSQQPTQQGPYAPTSPSMCLLGSPSKAQTPPCSPCSSISCEGGGVRHKLTYDVLKSLPGLPGWPGATCSCDNPLFAEQYGDRLG